MPVIRGKPKEQISYKCLHDLLAKMDLAIRSGEHSSRNDIIIAALRLFFENKNEVPENKVKEWLISPEGEEWMYKIIKKNLEKKR